LNFTSKLSYLIYLILSYLTFVGNVAYNFLWCSIAAMPLFCIVFEILLYVYFIQSGMAC